MSRRFLLACGGTGGHLAPGIALAEALGARGHLCRLLISGKPVDARLSGKYAHLDFAVMPGSGFSWRPARLARFLSSQARAVAHAGSLVRAWRPDFVVGFGGFTTAAVAWAARSARVPLALHEANRVPGRAIRLVGSIARRIYLPPGVERPSAGPDRVRHCGVPVRREFAPVPAEKARAALGLDPARPVVVVLGGSQGAQALNEWAVSAGARLAAESIQLVCVTGSARAGIDSSGEAGRASGGAVSFLPFCDDMAMLLSAADLAVCRAGAGTLAELARLRLPSVLVPFPHAADDHQAHNARWFAQGGGGLVLDQGSIAELTGMVVDLVRDTGRRRAFAAALERLDRGDAAEFIADDLESLLRQAASDRAREALAAP